MNTIESQIRSQNLLKIKQIIDKDNNGDKFILVRTPKNKRFMSEYGLEPEDVKDIIRELSVEDCYEGPERDRKPEKYKGWVFKFDPIFEGIKLYIKIRIEKTAKVVCMSIHKFGEYKEVE